MRRSVNGAVVNGKDTDKLCIRRKSSTYETHGTSDRFRRGSKSAPGWWARPNAACKLQVKVNPETGIIDDAKFKTFGCGSAIASSSLATEWLKGKTVDQALAIKNTDIVAELALPPVKIHCSVLAEDAIKAAIADLEKQLVEAPAKSWRTNGRA
jgi:hypothetical protein